MTKDTTLANRDHTSPDGKRNLGDLPPLEFEYVAFDAAQRALSDPPPGVLPLDQVDWLQRRGLPQPGDLAPTPDALLWFAQLPDGVRPEAVLHAYPRLINRMAQHWQYRDMALEVLDDLLIDRRGGRTGFAVQISRELATLRNWRATQP